MTTKPSTESDRLMHETVETIEMCPLCEGTGKVPDFTGCPAHQWGLHDASLSRQVEELQKALATARERTIEECAALVDVMIPNWRSNKDVQSVLASVAFGIRALAKPAAPEKGE